MVPSESADNHPAMDRIRRFTKTERAAHWLVAAAFGLMLLTGGMVPHHSGWSNTALDLHVGAAVVLVAGLVGLLIAANGRALRTTAGIEELIALIGDEDRWLRFLPAGKTFLELIGEIVHVDHCCLHTRAGQPVEHMVDERAPGKRHERLRHAQGERSHALAAAGRQDHGDIDHAVPILSFSSFQPSRGGTLPLPARFVIDRAASWHPV